MALADAYQLVSIILESGLYGVSLIVSAATVDFLLRKRKYSKTDIPMIIGALLIAVLATAQIFVDSADVYGGFIPLRNQAARVDYFNDQNRSNYATKLSIYFAMMILGDAIMIYRSYIVTARRIDSILLPSLCLVASAACAWQTVSPIHSLVPGRKIPLLEYDTNNMAIFFLRLVSNGIATSLISRSIWHPSQYKGSGSGRDSTPSLRIHILRIIAESGATNFVFILAYAILVFVQSPVIPIMSGVSTPLTSVVISMLIIRAAKASEDEAAAATLGKTRGNSAVLPSNKEITSTGEI